MIEESKNKERSASYPGFGLEEAIQFSDDLYNKMGRGPFSRDAIATALGHPSINNGAAIRKIASLVHFGLIQKESGKYFISDIARRILLPINETDRVEALSIAVATPSLYEKLITEYKNRSLPLMMENLLVHNYKISPKTSKAVANDFKQSLEYAGVLRNGVIRGDGSENSFSDFEKENIGDKEPEKSIAPGVNVKEDIQGMKSFSLANGIIISYPIKLERSFYFGKFGNQLAALEEVINKEIKAIEEDDEK